MTGAVTGAGTGGLRARIAEIIASDGPIPVSLYMLMCLHDPWHGYYATRAGFNRDFTTAPETSQVFGELIGLWAANQWFAMGQPRSVQLVELGPGRGTMMRDVLRVAASVPGFRDALSVSLVEASPLLRKQQLETLSRHAVSHVDTIEQVPAGPTIILANEFLDCLPIRQFVRDGEQWRERQIGLAADGALAFGLAPPAPLPADISSPQDQIEHAPGLDQIVDVLAARFRQDPGCALFVDYGPADTAPADTLRAFRDGAQVDPLATPGEADLTADVDFLRLRRLSEAAGLTAHGPVTHGAFLQRLGARQRSDVLAQANPSRAAEIAQTVETLVSPAQMGERFKALALCSTGLSAPPGFEA